MLPFVLSVLKFYSDMSWCRFFHLLCSLLVDSTCVFSFRHFLKFLSLSSVLNYTYMNADLLEWSNFFLLIFHICFSYSVFWEVPSVLSYSPYTCMCMYFCYHGFNFSKASLFICYLNVPSPLFWPPYFSLASSCFRCFVCFCFCL